jgi:glycosyltransferase involved in cell wall biosynthesis
MSKLQIHQFSPTAVAGDGITNGMLYFQKILNTLGFKSNIYVENMKSDFGSKVLSYKKFDGSNQNQILFIHYSIYYDFSTWIDTLHVKKHLIYHNITPPHFFEDNSFLFQMCQKGLEYLPSLKSKVQGAIGDSPLNSKVLEEYDFPFVRTIPLLMDMQKLSHAKYDVKLYEQIANTFSIIFVGRIAKNKAQHDLIKIAHYYRYINEDFKFYIIGGTTDSNYEATLKEEISKLHLQEHVIMSGKVSDEELYAYYKAANLFICMSEHEGFGIPLLEAMCFNVPVFAYKSSNIEQTLNGGGVLFYEKNHKKIASMIEEVRQNPPLKTEILRMQKKALQLYSHSEIMKQLKEYFDEFNINISFQEDEVSKDIIYQCEGPFDSSYSLAILNRYAAVTLEQQYPQQVSLYAREGSGDIPINQKFLENNPYIKELNLKATKPFFGDVALRNTYPPIVSDMKAHYNILNSYGWEESSFPLEYVKDFNEHLNGIVAVSHFVKKVLRSNGVRVPIKVISNPIDHLNTLNAKSIALKTKKSFRFLHISSCFPRKGVDILLKAYCESFTCKDDVALIIKTFPNPHHNIEQDVKEAKKIYPDFPEIEIINEDIEEEQLIWLYKNSHCLVAPSKAEGFGLPMAEAMLFDLPVITTGYGGQTDFCNEKTSWLIDYTFERAKTHLNLFNSFWVCPQVESLKKSLVELFELSEAEKREKTLLAKRYVHETLTWKNYAKELESFLVSIKKAPIYEENKSKIAWVSTYNTKCGIALYSQFLIDELSLGQNSSLRVFANTTQNYLDANKEDEITRCWKDRFDKHNNSLINAILKYKATHVVINFNFAFFSMQNLKIMLEKFYEKNMKVTIIFHSVEDVLIEGLESSLSWIQETLVKVDSILVHNIEDLNILKSFNVINNVTLFTQGVQKQRGMLAETSDTNKDFTFATFGFMLPHKGIKELIEAFSIVHKKKRDTKLLLLNALYDVDISYEYLQECKKVIQNLGLEKAITLCSDFLPEEEIYKKLESANLLVMPYQQTQESSSAAIRNALSTLKPILATPNKIFNDVADMIHICEDMTPKALAKEMLKCMSDRKFLHKYSERQQKWVQTHSWDNVAQKLKNLLFTEDY